MMANDFATYRATATSDDSARRPTQLVEQQQQQQLRRGHFFRQGGSGVGGTGTGNGAFASSRFACLHCWGHLQTYINRLRKTPEEIEQRCKSKEIDKFLEKEKQIFRRQVKLLLLGAGESGKSTFLKQMRIIHGIEFEPELLREYKNTIYQNILRGMKVLIDARQKLDISWECSDREKDAETIISVEFSQDEIAAEKFVQLIPYISRLWQDQGIKTAYERRREFQISDSVSYFFNEVDRLRDIDYVPSQRDILHCRKATKGVYEFGIKIQNIPFMFVDVGGQRTQRQKWTKCFDSSVTSILFLVSSSEFDQVLLEDRKTNRLEESKNIFDTIVNNNTFKGISIILFLNKVDLLKQKVNSSDTNISWYFPQFAGNPHSLVDVQNFILDIFMNVRKNKQSRIYHHFTTAIDTHNMEKVFSSVKNTILQRNLNALMLQ